MPQITPIQSLAIAVESCRAGALRFLDQNREANPEARRLASAAHTTAGEAAMLLVRQIAAASALRPYNGDAYYAMAERAMQTASDKIAAAWAIVDKTPLEDLDAPVLGELAAAELIDPEQPIAEQSLAG